MKSYNTHILLLLCCFTNILFAQTVSGHFPQLANQKISLQSFQGFKTYVIANTVANAEGRFSLNFGKSDYGMGFLSAEGQKPYFLILDAENTTLEGEVLSFPETIKVLEGKQNQAFTEYATVQPRREQAMSAWVYLRKMYEQDSLFSVQKVPGEAINKEIERLRAEEQTFIKNLPEKSYARWFLPIRKLVNTVSAIAQYRTEEIPGAIESFRSLSYTDERLYRSGLLKDVLESHFWLIENSGRPLDSVFAEMSVSIDRMVSQLVHDDAKLNLVTDYLFDLLERHSLFQASEYLAIKVLNETSCTLEQDLARQLETYRAMKKGNIAPEIDLSNAKLPYNWQGVQKPNRLSDIKSTYYVVVFGSSWCPQCAKDLPEIASLYQQWKKWGVEVVFVSLDDESGAYEKFVKDFPFISTCDLKKWDSQAVKDYYVFGTPTMFLLDTNRTILLRPTSVKQVDAWVDWYLVKGNAPK